MAVSTAITTKLVASQGCKHGSVAFNEGYFIALAKLHQRLAAGGIIEKLHKILDASWSTSTRSIDGASIEHAMDAAFVDDERLALMATTPHQLDASIDLLLSAVGIIFCHIIKYRLAARQAWMHVAP